ncbi:MAG: tol-pal system-associated acyl-CoA thioesterase [Acidiferrobacterales bacterium]|nr:tol-pal system-associated acyl-CoA thioesterase [Acidiferrobacterales bacterium]
MFEKTERVYYEDTDAGGVVYHANYLKYMERCRSEWLDSLGFSVAKLQQEQDIVFAVRNASIDFIAPARLLDELTVSCEILHIGKVKLLVEQKIYNRQQLLCSAKIKLATLEKTSFKLTTIPERLALQLLKSCQSC